jgi:mono/diheme cytochrome c family protein
LLTVALVMQVRAVRREIAALPAGLAEKRDVAALAPLGVRQVLSRRCVACHTPRALGTTVSMDPADLPALLERMQSHPGADIPSDELRRIGAALLVLRCARCHGDQEIGLMVLKSRPQRMATIRDMALLPGSGIRIDQIGLIASAFDELIEGADREPASIPAAQPATR